MCTRCYDRAMDDDAALTAHKRCMDCGAVTEMLRFRCPACGHELFDITSTGAGSELFEAMQARQKRAEQHTSQGGLLFQQGQMDEALAEFQQAIEVNPWNATAHGNIGVVFLRRGQPEEALRWFERALEIDPRVPGAKEMAEQVRSQLG